MVKTRRLPLAAKRPAPLTASTSTLTENKVTEVAPHLFNPASIHEALRAVNELETASMQGLVACGGRANSRDLALYLVSSGVLNLEKSTSNGVVPASEPHGSLY